MEGHDDVACPKSERQTSGGQRKKLGEVQVWWQVRKPGLQKKRSSESFQCRVPKEQVGLIFIFIVLVCFAITYSNSGTSKSNTYLNALCVFAGNQGKEMNYILGCTAQGERPAMGGRNPWEQKLSKKQKTREGHDWGMPLEVLRNLGRGIGIPVDVELEAWTNFSTSQPSWLRSRLHL